MSAGGSASPPLGATTASAAHISAALATPHYWSRLAGTAPAGLDVARHGVQRFSELALRQRVAEWRAAFALRPGTAIALYEPNGFEFAAALLGAWYAGKIVYLPGDAQPDTCQALANLHVTFVGQFPDEYQRAADAAHETHHTMSHPSLDESVDSVFAPLNADAAHLVIFTSGSTGAPQAVPKRLTQLLAETQTLEEQFGSKLEVGDVVVATVSHQHIYGLLFKILWSLDQFRAFESESLLYPEQLAAHLAHGSAVVVSGPAHLKRLPDSLHWSRVRDHVRAVFTSGGPLPLDAVARAETLLGVAPIEVYGSSETGGIAWRQRANRLEVSWTPLPNVEVRAEDGRLAVRSPHLATREWFLVEDHATFDAFGCFVLNGRADRIAKVEGKRVSLVAMEDAVLRTGLATEVRMVQLESSRDAIAAVVVLNDHGWSVLRAHGTSNLRQQLNDSLRDSVERIAHPRRWRWVDALPVNAAGKTTNAAIVSLFHAAGLTLPALHVLTASSTEVQAELYVSPHLPAFDGHFREIPVLPGVAQVDWAIVFGQKLFGISAAFARMEAVKFHRVYQPGPMLSLTLQWHPERRLLAFRYASPNATHSSGRIYFAV